MIRSTGTKTTRARGFAPWKPQEKSRALLRDVQVVLDTFRAYLPVTLRQVFYRLVSTVGYPKDEDSYERLCGMLNRARRAGIIEWDAIRDDGFTKRIPSCWETPVEWAEAVLRSATQYRCDRLTGQERRLVLWCEAGGMVPQLERVATEYSIPVYSSGGFDSVTAKHEVAEEFSRLGSATVLHIGDLDPSGVHMFGSLDEDVGAFLKQLGGDVCFVRLAVTREHVEQMGLPTAPPKVTDRRAFAGDTVQAEAIPPDELARIVRRAILDRLDGNTFDAVIAHEQEQRERAVEYATSLVEALR